jgi:putative peptidoglycan lipid II flippase
MLFKVLLATIIMAVFILNFNQSIEHYLNADAWLRALEITRIIGISAVIYFVSLKTLGVKLGKL